MSSKFFLTKFVSIITCVTLFSFALAEDVVADENCHEVSEGFENPSSAVAFLRDSFEKGNWFTKECIFAEASKLPFEQRFVVPFYYIWQNSKIGSYLTTRDFVEAKRLFFAYLGSNAAQSGSYERFAAYTVVFYEKVAPIEKLPFVGNKTPLDEEIAVKGLDSLVCFVLNDDLVSETSEITDGVEFQKCLDNINE